MLKTIPMLGLAAVLLTGCGSFCQGYTANGTRDMDGGCGRVVTGMAEREEIRKQKLEEQKEQIRQQRAQTLDGYANQCLAYGFSKGTDQFAQCVYGLDSAEANRKAEAALAAEASRQQSARAFEQWRQQEQQRLDKLNRGPVNTQCSQFGNQINCSSY